MAAPNPFCISTSLVFVFYYPEFTLIAGAVSSSALTLPRPIKHLTKQQEQRKKAIHNQPSLLKLQILV